MILARERDREPHRMQRISEDIVDDFFFPEIAIWNDDDVTVEGLDAHGTPVDFHHLALGIADLDPVADLEGTFDDEQESRNEIAQRILQCESDDERPDTKGAHDLGDIDFPDRRQQVGKSRKNQHGPEELEEQVRHRDLPVARGFAVGDKGAEEQQQHKRHSRPEGRLHDPQRHAICIQRKKVLGNNPDDEWRQSE